ncbi:MAG: TolC family protein [Bryobacteraceae bacterium]
MRKVLSPICVLLCLADLTPAQTPEPKPYNGTGFFSIFKRKYTPRYSAPVDYSNSPRLDKLMRAGRIYLSLEDAIALALENNLDIEYARYYPRLSDTDVLRANAGQLLRNLGTTNVRSGPPSASGALAGVSGVSAAGSGAGAGGQGGILSGVSVQLAGSAIPNLDPQFFVGSQVGHGTQILTNSFATGTNYLISNYKYLTYGITKGFLSGTTVRLDTASQNLSQNSPRNDFNPTTSGNLGLQISQRLLQGFGWNLNSRVIRIARNNRKAADLNFKAQVIATVANVVTLYWDLVSYNEILKVRQQALELNQRLYTDNKRRAELGAIAPIDIVQAEAEVAASQQDVTNAETQVLQQEMILKNVLTRSGIDNIAIAEARIVPTTRFQVPEREPVVPVQDLITEAMQRRPEIEQSQISLENSRLSIQGTKNALLPALDVYANFQNNGLAGSMNTLTIDGPAGQALIADRQRNLNPFFLGGYGTYLRQVFNRNFPDYNVGFSFSIPIRNSSAQADLIKDQLNFRQQQINDRQMTNNIRVNVINARTALMQARAAYDTSVKARMLQEQTLNGERRKFQLGTSSFLNVVIVQRDATARQAAEVQALNSYMRSKVNLETALGRILDEYKVSIDEAYGGTVKREPSLPIAPTAGNSK